MLSLYTDPFEEGAAEEGESFGAQLREDAFDLFVEDPDFVVMLNEVGVARPGFSDRGGVGPCTGAVGGLDASELTVADAVDVITAPERRGDQAMQAFRFPRTCSREFGRQAVVQVDHHRAIEEAAHEHSITLHDRRRDTDDRAGGLEGDLPQHASRDRIQTG